MAASAHKLTRCSGVLAALNQCSRCTHSLSVEVVVVVVVVVDELELVASEGSGEAGLNWVSVENVSLATTVKAPLVPGL